MGVHTHTYKERKAATEEGVWGGLAVQTGPLNKTINV